MTLQIILLIANALFLLSEVALALVKHSQHGAVQREDRGSMLWMWLCACGGIALAIAAHWFTPFRLPGPQIWIQRLALIVLAGGLILRWMAILALGRHFTVDIAIHPDHVVFQRGPYRLVRHPSYTGLLLAFLGLTIFLANWLSILVLMVPFTLATLNRVAKEEKALLASLGENYAEYRARTKRFIPGVY
jgi:protein-S-isoprenylcysteine O-methyltransferase Ste14